MNDSDSDDPPGSSCRVDVGGNETEEGWKTVSFFGPVASRSQSLDTRHKLNRKTCVSWDHRTVETGLN